MTIHLPKDLENSIRSEVLNGHFESEDDLVAEAVREYLRLLRVKPPRAHLIAKAADDNLGSIGAMRDATDELDEIVADAMQKRREETWRVMPGE